MRRLALLVVVGALSLTSLYNAFAEEEASPGYTAFDISWPQCPKDLPDQRFEFAIIGLNNGRPFTANPCFATQYQWARAAEPHPDIYINVDFPKAGRTEAMNGPWGPCQETDHWCRGYNWGYNLAADAVARAGLANVTPSRFWLDVETDNYWSNHAPDNSQVVRGAIDYLVDNRVPTGIYSTYYQWGLITGNFMPKAKLPIWVAGATDQIMASERCNQERFTFAGGETWLVQYVVGKYDHNHECAPRKAQVNAREAGSSGVAVESAAQAQATAPVAPPATATPQTEVVRAAAAPVDSVRQDVSAVVASIRSILLLRGN